MNKSSLSFLIGILIMFPVFVNAQKQPYFQQEVKYDIEVFLEAFGSYLSGNYSLTYTNHSPDTLRFIYMHLYPNAYGNTESQMAQELLPPFHKDKIYFAKEEEQGYISGLDFTSPKQKLTMSYIEPDIVKIGLQKPLLPEDSIRINTPYNIQVPEIGYSRMGRESGNYQITQWFPKPAVYDMEGWNLIPYLKMGEYYGEFGNFNIRLMVPKNHTVGCTGTILKTEPWKAGHLSGNTPKITEVLLYKTIFVKAENVHTFAWCSGKDYKRLTKRITIKKSGKEIKAHILYRDDKGHWFDQFEIIEGTINYYSDKVGVYPYPQVTVAQSAGDYGGGMEYPMFTLLDKSFPLSQANIIIHEIGHNWFYGVLGFNEREHPWMDEGFNTFFQYRYLKKKFPDLTLKEYLFDENIPFNIGGIDHREYVDIFYLSYRALAAKKLDLPITLSRKDYNAGKYFIQTYYIPALKFKYLMSLIGEDSFDNLFRSFYEKWKFKHPQPEDFYNHLKTHYPEPGKWFAEEMLQTNKRVDYAIKKVKSLDDSVEITLKNNGNMAAPFMLHSQRTNKDLQLSKIKGFQNKKTLRLAGTEKISLKIDPFENLPETDRKNNEYNGNKLFPKAEKISLKWLYHVPDPDKRFIFYTPVIGFNHADRVMPGLLLYNDPVYSVPVHYRLAPLYSFGTSELNGEGRISYTGYTGRKHLKAWQISTYGKKYNYSKISDNDKLHYMKIRPELNFFFSGSPDIKIKTSHQTGLRYHFISKQYKKYLPGREFGTYYTKNVYRYFHVFEAFYHYEQEKIHHNKSFDMNLQYWDGHLKFSTEYNYRLQYNQKDNAIEFRAFGGAFLAHGNNTDLDMRFRLSNWSGNKDYLFDHTMPYRGFINDHLLNHHMQFNDGGFNIMTPLGQSWKHLYALNMHIDLPIVVPLGLFGSVGNFGKSELEQYESDFFYETGVTLSIFQKHIRIYYSFFFNFNDEPSVAALNKYANLRFTFDLDHFNPFNMVRKIDPAFK
ncbi:MAG: M1 family metallopeptidase [Bacteroidales bacterium]|nr:M1 family metallopeptidase [Bacteroidales bacterium]